MSEHRKPSLWTVARECLPMIGQLLRTESEMSAEEREAFDAALGRRSALGNQPRIAGQVAIISVRGLITPRPSLISMLFGNGTGGLIQMRDMFREAIASDDVGAIVLEFDSPGGVSDLVPEVAAEILAARGSKPIVAIANTMCASAAYWLGSQADEFVITPSGLAGSIGVYTTHWNWEKFNQDFGVIPTYITAGKYKAEANPDAPLSEDAKAHLQEMVDDCYEQFVEAVAAGRKATAAQVRDGYGEGRVLTARAAVDAGLADRVATLDEVIADLVGRAGSGNGPSAAAPAPTPKADEPPAPKAEVPETEPPAEPEPVQPPTPAPAPSASSADHARRLADVMAA